MSVSAASVPARAQGSDTARLGQDFVVLDPAGKMLRGFNPSAARVWELIDGVLTAEQIAARIAAEFGVPGPSTLAEVLSFLEILSSKRLVSV